VVSPFVCILKFFSSARGFDYCSSVEVILHPENNMTNERELTTDPKPFCLFRLPIKAMLEMDKNLTVIVRKFRWRNKTNLFVVVSRGESPKTRRTPVISGAQQCPIEHAGNTDGEISIEGDKEKIICEGEGKEGGKAEWIIDRGHGQ